MTVGWSPILCKCLTCYEEENNLSLQTVLKTNFSVFPTNSTRRAFTQVLMNINTHSYTATNLFAVLSKQDKYVPSPPFGTL